MVRTKDPILSVFRQRDNLSVREAYMVQMQKEADSHKEPRRPGGKKGGKKAKAAAKSSAGGDE
jgi:2-keto-4-pentenoate hydratase